jgi:indole-3-glycerol phosphate synthase
MADILDGIVQRVRDQLAARPADPASLLDAARAHRGRDFAGAIMAGPRPALIAEFKRRSPSRGALAEDAAPADYCRAYAAAGASAISVLTNPDFGGSLHDLREARQAVDLPLLRKDFIVDVRQLLDAAAAGADCVLLVCRLVEPARLAELVEAAHGLHLQALVEVYQERELEPAIAARPDLLGVNSRDLGTFAVDSSKFARIAALVPPGLPLVAESGVTGREAAVAAAEAGARAVLVGEALMTAPDPGARARELVGATVARR